MKPFPIYHLYSDAFLAIQRPLVDRIVHVAKPIMVFLIGASLQRRRSESIFNGSSPSSQYISDCFLLVLIKDLSNKEPHEWQDMIEANCRCIIPITTIVMQQSSFEEWIKEGHPFATNVQRSAALIYNPDNCELPLPHITNNGPTDKAFEKLFTDGLTKAKEFLAGSELFRVRKQHAMAAFMLHQSAEQALRTLLNIGTGYHANTHSIDRLLRYAGLVSYQLPDIFPQRTEEEKRLFNLLQKAYVDTRYKEDYKINIDDLMCLTEKIKHLHEILFEVGKQISKTIQPSTL